MSSSSVWLLVCGVFCVYPLIVTAIGIQLYRAYVSGAFRRNK